MMRGICHGLPTRPYCQPTFERQRVDDTTAKQGIAMYRCVDARPKPRRVNASEFGEDGITYEVLDTASLVGERPRQAAIDCSLSAPPLDRFREDTGQSLSENPLRLRRNCAQLRWKSE
jgi:hypothetical protein